MVWAGSRPGPAPPPPPPSAQRPGCTRQHRGTALSVESLQVAFGCSPLACRGGRPLALDSLCSQEWTVLKFISVCWGASTESFSVVGLVRARELMQPLQPPGAVPAWPDRAFSILVCLLQDTSHSSVLTHMWIGTVSARNHPLPHPRPGSVPACAGFTCSSIQLLFPAQPLPTLSLQLY